MNMDFKKFLVVGLTAVMSFNAIAAPALNNINSVEKIMEQVQVLQLENAIPKVPVNYIIKAESEIKSNRLEAMANLTGLKHCEVNIEATPDMTISYTGTKINRDMLKEVTSASNSAQEYLRTEYITYHETAHCRMYEIKDVFQHHNPQVESKLNEFFKFSAKSYQTTNINGNASIYFMLHENFADSFAFIQLLKANGPTKDVLETMQKIQIERSDAANQYNKDGYIVHNTEFALKEILKEENIKKILDTNDQGELQQMALNFANKGLWQSVATYSKANTHEVMNMESLNEGALFLVNHMVFAQSTTVAKTEKNININFENNTTYEVAKEVVSELNKNNDFTKMDAQQVGQFLQENKEQIVETLYKKMDSRFNVGDGMSVAEFISTEIDKDATQYNTNAKHITQIKADGIEDLKTINTIADNLSKNTVLQNAKQMQKKFLDASKNTVRIVNNMH